jgi:asparagine synthase (glutamine-hydrolysing)
MYVFSGGKILNIWPYEYFDWSIAPEATDLEEALYASVQRRLISKKEEVAALVSGGLDSSIISYILSDLGRSVSYYTTDNLEDLNYVRKLSEQLKFNPHIIHYNMDSADFTDALEWNETPIDLGSMVPEHKLISGVKERIVLTGDGADELFGGYRRIDQYDSQYSDVFEELTYYHLPRLDRASMRYTVEMRNPFLSHDIIKLALSLPLEKRTHKKILKDIFRGKLPDEILDRPKLPLKNDSIREDPMKYRLKLVQTFYDKQL